MGAATAWFTTVILLLGGVLVFYQLGLNMGPLIGNALHGVEQVLGQPIIP